jgi:hypothetical protein
MRPWLRVGELDANGLFYLAARGVAGPRQGADAAGLYRRGFDGRAKKTSARRHRPLEAAVSVETSPSIAEIRADFRAGGGWHYLDSGATAQKPQAVIDATVRAMGAITPPSIAASMPAAPT